LKKTKWLILSAAVVSLMVPISSIGATVSFDALTRSSIAALTIQDSIIDGSDSSINKIPTGTVLAYKTTSGLLGKMKVLKYGYNLALKIVTYNADGSVAASADSTIIRGTFFCNLDSAKEVSSGGDFWWEQATAVRRILIMTHPAKIAVYSTPTNVVTNFTLSPASPATLANSQHVSVHFSYTTIANHGARIWAIPYFHGSSPVGTTYQGSTLVPSGSDTSSRFFTITSGIANIDSVRILMTDSAGTTTLFETYIPVSYYFGPNIVTNVVPTPASPATLATGANVGFTFDYTTANTAGARIFIRPFTKGALSPNYGASGSPLYAVGSGTGTGSFTITSTEVKVDSARIQMWNAAQDTLLYEAFLPVNFTFKPNSITNIQTTPASPAVLVYGDSVKVTFSYFANQKVRLFARPWSKGALSPHYGAHGSGVYGASAGADSGRAWFTITLSDTGVDSVRVQMWDSANATLLTTAYLAVNYQFKAGIITNAVLTPASPATLSDNAHVSVHFNYRTVAASGVRIWAIPYYHGSQVLTAAYQGSVLRPAGSDTSSQYFTITSGTAAVDSVDLRMADSAGTTTLFEIYLPVNYTFTPPTGIVQRTQIQPKVYGLTALSNGTIRFAMPVAGKAVIKLYTGNGRCAATLLNRTMTSGYHQMQWEAAKGIYIVRMDVNGRSLTTRMTVAK
jgi:uncharacterized protein (DUF427 family)